VYTLLYVRVLMLITRWIPNAMGYNLNFLSAYSPVMPVIVHGCSPDQEGNSVYHVGLCPSFATVSRTFLMAVIQRNTITPTAHAVQLFAIPAEGIHLQL